MKKIIIYLLSFVIASFVLEPWQSQIPTILAASATPSPTATPSASITPSETQDIQQKIKNLVKENLSATETSLKDKINLQTLVGYVGEINSINSGNISIDSKDDNMIQITTNENTVYSKSGSNIKLSSLALSDKIIIIGTLLNDNIVLAKKVVVVEVDSNPMISGTIYATIVSLDSKKKTISLSINGEEIVYSLTKKSDIKLSELKPGQNIFAITKKYEGKDYLSRAKVI